MIEQFKVITDDKVSVVAKKLSDVISEVNNLEARQQSASLTNSDCTAALFAEINRCKCDILPNIGCGEMHLLAARLNSVVVKAQQNERRKTVRSKRPVQQRKAKIKLTCFTCSSVESFDNCRDCNDHSKHSAA